MDWTFVALLVAEVVLFALVFLIPWIGGRLYAGWSVSFWFLLGMAVLVFDLVALWTLFDVFTAGLFGLGLVLVAIGINSALHDPSRLPWTGDGDLFDVPPLVGPAEPTAGPLSAAWSLNARRSVVGASLLTFATLCGTCAYAVSSSGCVSGSASATSFGISCSTAHMESAALLATAAILALVGANVLALLGRGVELSDPGPA